MDAFTLGSRLRLLAALAIAPFAVTALLGANCGGTTIPQRKIGNARLGAGCQYDTFAAALAAAADGDVLQVRTDRDFTENVLVNKAVQIRATVSPICVPAPPAPDGDRPQIRAAGANTTMTITASGNVLLADLVIRNGNGVDGGNLATAASAAVTLAHVDLLDGNAQRGGGAFALGTLALGTGTAIARNTATEGGGIYVEYGALELGDVVIEGNSTETDGAGIYADHATVTEADAATSIEVRDNHAQRDGGGIFVTGGSLEFATTVASRNVADENGGGLAVSGAPPAVLRIGALDHNSASQGGGFSAEGGVTISRLGDVTNNSASFGGGGAYLDGGAVIDTRADFADNSAGQVGGGVSLYHGSVWKGGGTLVGNSAGGVGGGAMLSGSTLDWTGVGGEIAGNSAGAGGGVYLNCLSSASLLVSHGNLHGNSAGDGGAVFADGFASGTCLVQLTAATALEDNVATQDGGGIAALGRSQLYLKELKARRNRAGRNGGAIATLTDDAGVPSITVFNRDDGLPGCLHAPFVPGFDEYCVEFRDNEAGGDGAALHLASATGSIAQAGFTGNDATGRGDAVVLGGIGGAANLRMDSVLFADHAAASEVIWVAGGSMLTAQHVTAASNTGVPIRWSTGSAGSLLNSAIADVALAIDAGLALAGDCNAVFAAPAGGGTLGGAFDVGLTTADFFTDAVRGRFQVASGAPLLDDRCTAGGAFDIDDAPRDARPDRGAFEE